MERLKKPALAALVVLVAALAVPPVALADYVDSSGNIVHWAGGNNIVVTDKNGNTVYSGAGTRSSDGSRLLWNGTSNVGSSSGRQVSSAVTESYLAGKPAGQLGLMGETPSASTGTTSSGTQRGSSSSSPMATSGPCSRS